MQCREDMHLRDVATLSYKRFHLKLIPPGKEGDVPGKIQLEFHFEELQDKLCIPILFWHFLAPVKIITNILEFFLYFMS